MYLAKTKIFDPLDPSTGTRGSELLDATVIHREGRWRMYLAGQAAGYGPTELFSAGLPQHASLSAEGWQLDRSVDGQLIPLAARERSNSWDGRGGRHCPSYVRGWDPREKRWAERIYYAGAADNLWGPYTIGYLEWDGARWVDQPNPVFRAQEEWERGSVYEPNLIYDEGRWKMWYVAGSNQDDYIVHGYAESDDGIQWVKRTVFAPPDFKMFDFNVSKRAGDYVAVFSRVWLKDGAPSRETGLWWCEAKRASANLRDWSMPVQILSAEATSWHGGTWKPSVAFSEHDARAFVFFDGSYRTNDSGPFPFVMTQGVIEIDPGGLAVK
jgi:hypothetical protein